MEGMSGGGKAVAAGRMEATAKLGVKNRRFEPRKGVGRTKLETRRRDSAVREVYHWKSFNPSEVPGTRDSELM